MFDDEYFPNKPFCMYDYTVNNIGGKRYRQIRKNKIALMKIRKDIKYIINNGNLPIGKKYEYIEIANKLKSDINDSMCNFAMQRKNTVDHNSTGLKMDLEHNRSILNYGNSNFKLENNTTGEENTMSDKKKELIKALSELDSDSKFDTIILKYVCDMITDAGNTEAELIKCIIDNAFIYRNYRNIKNS